MSRAALLAKVSLFQGLETPDLQRVAAAMEPVVFEPGHTIVAIGDPGRSLFVIVDGTVQVLCPARASDFELARLGPGDFFGEMALLNDRPRSATVRALTRVGALKLERDAFRRMILRSPRMGIGIMEYLSLDMRAADEQRSDSLDPTQPDPLTGLHGRRAFHERMSDECQRHRRYGHPFAVVLLDLDRPGIDARFGHAAGDAAMSWIARLLTEHTRAPDVPFRIGGEELALLCPSITAEAAHRVAVRVVELVSVARPPVPFEMKVTLSAGLSGCPDHGMGPDDVYRVADRALLRARSEGRGRVCAPEELVR